MKIVSGLSCGQVLQRLGTRGATVALVGTAMEDGPITVTLFKANTMVRGWKNRPVGKIVMGKFSVKLTGLPVGGPFVLRLQAGGQRVDIAPFFVGDVWIVAGQSNMEGVGNIAGAAKPHPLVRAFSMRREWRLAEDRLHVLAESPDVCHATFQCPAEFGEEFRKKSTKGVGPGLFFGREMVERSGGVPQGLICTAHGGTSMQQWSPDRKHLGGESLYASMLTSVRVTGQPVAGILWYQGESDTNPQDAGHYTSRMKKLVIASRRDLDQPDLPWITVQIARVFMDPASPLAWNSIQEQQRLLPGKIKFLETVPAIDLPLDDGIHIGAEGCPRLAARLASAASRLVYGHKSEGPMPQFRGVRLVDTSPPFAVEVAFDGVCGALRAAGEPGGFQFMSPEGTPVDLVYKTELRGNTVLLHLSKKPAGPVDLFYGHGFTPRCNITDARGFSLPVFGPVSIGRRMPRALLPHVTQWRKSEIIPATKKLDRVSLDEVKAYATTAKSYPQLGFIKEHDAWTGRSGLAFFHSRLHLAEPMKLEFLLGYDGPFRLWLDEKPFFKNMAGTNPCAPETSRKTARLEAGLHDLHVGMDLNDGRAWGFYFRLARKDVTREQIRTGDFLKPSYLI